MAEVFLVRAEPSGSLAVLKRILPHFADDARFVDMFRDEMAIASRLKHPSICRVYRSGVEDGRYFYTMEYVHGDDLGWVLGRSGERDERLPMAASLHILGRLSEALHAAHEAVDDRGAPLEIVHRDVNPSNVMLGYDGAVKLLDFGIARARQRRARTTVGGIKGKISYMSPEQCRGKPLDRRADVFALGVMCWELVTGRELFGGETEVSTLNRIVNEPVRPPSSARSDLPAELDALVLRALARRPDDRFPTAAAFGRALHHVASTMGVTPSAADVRAMMHALLGSRVARLPEANVAATDDDATTIERRVVEVVPAPAPPPAAAVTAITTAKPVPSRQPVSRRLWMASIAGVSGVAALGWLAGRHLGEPRADVSSAVAERDASPGAAAADADADGATVAVRLRVRPRDARVEVDGVAVDGPVVRLPRSSRTHEVVVSASGYRRARRVITADRGSELRIELVRRRARKPRTSADSDRGKATRPSKASKSKKPRRQPAEPDRPAIDRIW